MFYRILALVLVATAVMVTQLSELPSISLFSSQATVSSNTQTSEVPASATIAEITTELVSNSPTTVNDDFEAPLTLVSSQDHLMVLDESSIASAQSSSISKSVSNSVWVSETPLADSVQSVDIELPLSECRLRNAYRDCSTDSQATRHRFLRINRLSSTRRTTILRSRNITSIPPPTSTLIRAPTTTSIRT